MQWFYAKGGEQTGPLEDHVFHDRVRTGEITPDTPVWREGMPNWMPYGQISSRSKTANAPRKKLTLRPTDSAPAPATPPATPVPPPTAATRSSLRVAPEAEPPDPQPEAAAPAPIAAYSPAVGLIEPLHRARSWIRALGILSIVTAIFHIHPLWQLAFAWIPVWLGILLIRIAALLGIAFTQGNEAITLNAMEKLRRYFQIAAILAIITVLVSGYFFVRVTIPAIQSLLH